MVYIGTYLFEMSPSKVNQVLVILPASSRNVSGFITLNFQFDIAPKKKLKRVKSIPTDSVFLYTCSQRPKKM